MLLYVWNLSVSDFKRTWSKMLAIRPFCSNAWFHTMTIVLVTQENSLILYLYASEGISFSLFEKLMENHSAHALSAEKT